MCIFASSVRFICDNSREPQLCTHVSAWKHLSSPLTAVFGVSSTDLLSEFFWVPYNVLNKVLNRSRCIISNKNAFLFFWNFISINKIWATPLCVVVFSPIASQQDVFELCNISVWSLHCLPMTFTSGTLWDCVNTCMLDWLVTLSWS